MPLRESENFVILWIWIGIGLFILVTLFTILLVIVYLKNIKKHKTKVKKIIRSTQVEYGENILYLQEKDRERLAEELHDNIISRLNLIRLNIEYKNLKDVNLEIKKSMQLIRELSHNLTPPDINDIDLSDLVADYLEQVKNNINVDFYLLVSSKVYINSIIKINLFRILQELINNVLKHADASLIKISLRISNKRLILIVEDNGAGFETKVTPIGIGHRSIELRAKKMNAYYKLKTKPKRGSKYIFFINLSQ